MSAIGNHRVSEDERMTQEVEGPVSLIRSSDPARTVIGAKGPLRGSGRTHTYSRGSLAVAAFLTVATLVGGWPVAATARPGRAGVPARESAPRVAPPAVDPGVAGPNAVDELSYNLGDLAFQPDGFPGRVELKGRVYAPEVITGQAPLVVLMHGRHVTCASATTEDGVWPCPAAVPEVPSYLGYAKLGRNLASHGMVVVSIGANGINAADGYVDDGGAAARAELVLEHLRRWQAWNASAAGSPFGARFVGHIDLADVGLMGHSRGGEGVVAAAQLNQRIGSPFGIKAVLALAPVDFSRRVLGGVPLSVILPYCDGDVSDLQGTSYYDDGRYASPGDPAPKATTLLYGANHNFFNTVWTSGPGSFDDAEFIGDGGGSTVQDTCSVGGAARLTAPQEEQAGAVLMAGFFRRYLTAEAGLQRFVTGTAPFPASTGAARWSVAFHEPARLDVARFDKPDTYRVNNVGRLADLLGVSSGLICNFANTGFGFGPPSPQSVSTTSCPASGDQAATNDTGTLDVGWVRPGAVVRQPLATAGTDVSAYDGLRFRVAVVGDDRNDTRPIQRFNVVLEDAAGHRATVSTDGRTNALSRLPASQVRHAVLNGVRLPLGAFTGVDLTRVRAVELSFDITGAGRLAISDLAFTAEGTGSAVGPAASGATGTVIRPTCRQTEARRWGCALANLAWGRDPYPDEMNRLTAGYATADTRRFTIAVVLSAAATRDVFDKRYAERYIQGDVDGDGLERSLSPAGKAHWERALAELADNLSFSTARVDTPGEQVDALYQTLTGRSPDPAGRAYWVTRVNDRGPGRLATELRRSIAGRGRIVDDRYRQILGRRPDAGGRTYWIGRLNAADGERQFVATLLETESFRLAASS